MTWAGATAGGPLLACSAEDLRAAARQLRAAGAQVEELAERAGATVVVDGGWSGLAALEMQAAVESAQRLLHVLAGPGLEAAAVLDEVAGAAEEALTQVRRWARDVDDALDELGGLRAVGPPPESLLQEAWRRRVAELEARVDHAREQLRRTEEDFATVQRRAATILESVWSSVQTALAHVGVLHDLRGKASTVVRHGRRAVVSTVGLVALAHLRWSRSEELRSAARTRLDGSVSKVWAKQVAAAEALRQASGVLAPARRLLARASAVGAWALAVQDVRTGADHDGWRAGITRVLAGGAVVGMPAAVLLVGTPAGLVAVGAVSAYHLWLAGNWLHDHRATILPAVRWGARQVGEGARQAGRGVRQVGGVVQRAQERAGRGLRRLRQQARDVGSGLLDRLPQTVPSVPGASP